MTFDGNWNQSNNPQGDGHCQGLNFSDVMRNACSNGDIKSSMDDMRDQLIGTRVAKQLEINGTDLAGADHCLQKLDPVNTQKAVDAANKTLQQDGSSEQLQLSTNNGSCQLTLVDGERVLASDSWKVQS